MVTEYHLKIYVKMWHFRYIFVTKSAEIVQKNEKNRKKLWSHIF
jgi:hypothetical protein